MVYKSVDHGKLWSICFLPWLFLYKRPKTKEPALCDMLCHFHGLYCYRPWLSTNQHTRIRSVIVKYPLLLFLQHPSLLQYLFYHKLFTLSCCILFILLMLGIHRRVMAPQMYPLLFRIPKCPIIIIFILCITIN